MAKKHPKHISTKLSAETVKDIVKQKYEPGRQDRCKEWVYRTIIKKQTGISRRTFFRYLKINNVSGNYKCGKHNNAINFGDSFPFRSDIDDLHIFVER